MNNNNETKPTPGQPGAAQASASTTTRQMPGKPAEFTRPDVRIGSLITAQVTRQGTHGVFMTAPGSYDFPQDFEVFLPKTAMRGVSAEQKSARFAELEPGLYVSAHVTAVREVRGKPWEVDASEVLLETAESIMVGSQVVGAVKTVTAFGVFVNVCKGVDGLVHISQMPGYRASRKPQGKSGGWTAPFVVPYKIGDQITAVVTDVELKDGHVRVSLSVMAAERQQQRALAEACAARLSQRGEISVVVAGEGFDADGAEGYFVELEPGIEGFLRKEDAHYKEGTRIGKNTPTKVKVNGVAADGTVRLFRTAKR